MRTFVRAAESSRLVKIGPQTGMSADPWAGGAISPVMGEVSSQQVPRSARTYASLAVRLK